jgi:hypothetical protein
VPKRSKSREETVKNSIAENVWRHVRRLPRERAAVPTVMERDDVSPYLVLAGEVARAKTVLASRTGPVVVATPYNR